MTHNCLLDAACRAGGPARAPKERHGRRSSSRRSTATGGPGNLRPIDGFLAQGCCPATSKKFPGLGCREVQWRDKGLMLVCFVAQGEIVHLFVVPKAELRDAPIASIPTLARVKGWTTANWTRGDVVFLALTRADEEFLNKLLADPNRI